MVKLHPPTAWERHQKVRCSRSLGHFYKWHLGDGEHCPWCWLCRTFPIFQKVIDYSYYGTMFCQDCGYHLKLDETYDRVENPYPDCPECGGITT